MIKKKQIENSHKSNFNSVITITNKNARIRYEFKLSIKSMLVCVKCKKI